MAASFKELTNFFKEIGAADVGHTSKTYLAHCIGVRGDMKKWGGDEVMRGGATGTIVAPHSSAWRSAWAAWLKSGLPRCLRKRAAAVSLRYRRLIRAKFAQVCVFCDLI